MAVLECGKRFRDEDFARSSLREPRRYFWAPAGDARRPPDDPLQGRVRRLRQRSRRRQPRLREHPLPGAARPSSRTRSGPRLGEWEAELAPHYETAERMLGVTEYEGMGPADRLLQGIRGGDRRRRHLHATPGSASSSTSRASEVPDPYFEGEGPARTGCMRCGSCMVGCRHGAKNTLVKNYLWFAEKLGVEILPERQVTEIRPLGAADGSDGYARRQRALGGLGAPAAQDADGARRGRRRRRPRHQQPARQLQALRRPAPPLGRGSATWSGPTPSRSSR